MGWTRDHGLEVQRGMAVEGGADQRERPAAQAGWRLLVFAACAFAWLRWRVDPSLGYYGAGLTSLPPFSPDPLFIADYCHRIGGPVDLLNAWLSQFFCSPLAGAALLTALAACFAVAFDRVGQTLAGRRLPGLRYVAALAFLLADGHYLHVLGWQLGWLAAVLATDLYLRWPPRRLAPRILVLLTGSAVLYYLVGGAVGVAVPLLLVGEASRRETQPLAIVGLVWVAALPWQSTWCGFDRSPAQAYREFGLPLLRNDPDGTMAYALSVLVPAAALLLGALAARARTAQAPPRPPRPVLAWLGLAAAVAVLPLAEADAEGRGQLQLASQIAHREWSAAIATADRLHPLAFRYLEGYETLLALAQTGQMGEAMFRYPVTPYSLLRSIDPRMTKNRSVGDYRTAFGLQLGTLELELGFVNEAEQEAHEALEILGPYPTLLLTMGRIQAFKGRPEAARVFLRLAAGQAGSRREAKALLAALDRDPTLAGEPSLQAIRRAALRTDIYAVSTTTGTFEALLAEHPESRLAAEYCLGWYLLSNQLDKLVAALPRLPAFSRSHLPVHYEEAVLCWEAETGRRAELGRWQVREETRASFDAFVRALGCDRDELRRVLLTHGPPPPWAEAVWQGPWNNTYFHYRLFGIAGLSR